MEFIIFITIVIAGLIYYQMIQIKNQRNEQLLKDFVSMIVPCKIEKRDGYYFVYNGLNSMF